MRFVGCVICCNCFGGGTDISAMVRPIGVKVCTMVELRPEVSSPLLVAISSGVSKCGVKKVFGWTILASHTPFFAM